MCWQSKIRFCEHVGINPLNAHLGSLVSGRVQRICFNLEMSADNVQKTVTDLLDEWNCMSHLFEAVWPFADVYNNQGRGKYTVFTLMLLYTLVYNNQGRGKYTVFTLISLYTLVYNNQGRGKYTVFTLMSLYTLGLCRMFRFP